MGIGMVVEPDGKLYFICNYNPAGNVEGGFALNVTPPMKVRINKDFYNSLCFSMAISTNVACAVNDKLELRKLSQ